MPQNAWCAPNQENCDDPASRKETALSQIVPKDRRKIYDMRKIVSLVVDKGSVFEVTKSFGKGQITCFARLNGHPVGIFANDCRYYAGSMTADGSQKVKRFIKT